MITVTKTFLPSLDEYQVQIKKAFKSQWLTNRGRLVLDLERKLKKYLDVNNVILTANGTIPMQIALKLLGKGGEIITSPFSYVATTAVIVWENCTPIFVDIDPEYLTIDEKKIEAKITSKTTAILATHIFGNPCNIEEIERIAKKHKLSVIYDAAHCFGVTYQGKSIFDFGDVSTCSFHATKIFHTGEGGAMFCKNKKLQHKLYYSHNFGHNPPLGFYGLGINGKMSELQAAMGLAILPHMREILLERGKVIDYYDCHLDFSNLQRMKLREKTHWNNSYYPVIFRNEKDLLKVETLLTRANIIPRRYFYPSLNKLPYIKSQKMPISESISSRILCLPLYVGLSINELAKICKIINNYNV